MNWTASFPPGIPTKARAPGFQDEKIKGKNRKNWKNTEIQKDCEKILTTSEKNDNIHVFFNISKLLTVM